MKIYLCTHLLSDIKRKPKITSGTSEYLRVYLYYNILAFHTKNIISTRKNGQYIWEGVHTHVGKCLDRISGPKIYKFLKMMMGQRWFRSSLWLFKRTDPIISPCEQTDELYVEIHDLVNKV